MSTLEQEKEREVSLRRAVRVALEGYPNTFFSAKKLQPMVAALVPGELRYRDVGDALDWNVNQGHVERQFNTEAEADQYRITDRGIVKVTREDRR